ncbi:hypothetical protein RJ55_06141 [Drechmeria coniospora]|nr:hypothetical protein RJ55_06141 [Drechmeria coniospora]
MRFQLSLSAVLALAASAFAQTADFDPIYTPKSNEVIPAGSPYSITWSAPAKYAAGTISIHLIGGATQNTQVPIMDIASGIKNSDNGYTWLVDATLGSQAVYGLVIKLESDPSIFQYSMPFQIKGNGVVTTGTTSRSSASTTTDSTTTGSVTTTTTQHSTTSYPTTHVGYNSTSIAKPTHPSNSTTLATKPVRTSGARITSTAAMYPTATSTTPAKVPANAASVVGAGSLGVVAALALALVAM